MSSALVAALLVVLGTSKVVSSDSGEQPECLATQFYYEPLGSCRNCSDIGHLFHSYQDWLGTEVVSNSNSNSNNNNNNNKASIVDTTKRKLGANGDEVLSRLIGPLESSTTSDQTDDTADESDQSGNGNQLASNHDSDDVSSNQDNHDGLSTRQMQKLVARFLLAPSNGNELLDAVEQCRQHQNQSACQMWSNLCVATMYSYSDSGTSSQSSAAALKSAFSMSTRSQGRKLWQQCEQFSLLSVCNSLRDWWRLERKPNSVDILNIYAADEPLSSKAIASSGLQLKLNQPIQLLAYKYTYHGHFIGVDQFGLDQMERFCLGRSGSLASSKFVDANNREMLLRVGKSMELRCGLESGAMMGASYLNETVFIDLYLGYQQNGAFFVKPVPILIKNLLYNGQQINRKYPRDPTRWKLIHRFLFHSILELEDEDEALVYAKSVQLDLKFKRQDKGMLLSSILLTLDYDYIIGSNSSSGKNHFFKQPITEITITQTLMDMLSYRKDLDLVVTILSIMSSIWSMLKCYHIQKCHGLVKLDLESLFRFLLISCDTLANLFVLITITFAGLLFFALKFHLSPSSVQLLGPSQDLEDALRFNIQLAFMFKLIGLTHILYNPLQADIFFIDWERPKMLTSAEILQHFSHYSHNNTKQQPSNAKVSTTEQQQNQNHLTSISSNIQQQQQHQQYQSAGSFWRPYTIINKWLQMQTFRRQDTTLQLFLFVCFVNLTQILQLTTVDADYLTSSSGSFAMKSSTSQAFRMFLLSAIYLGLSGAQVLVKKYILETMFGNKVHEFIDLCSVANVSLFCMLYPKFGYYLHGRNANGSGECGIAEINALLEREERDLCSKRGLAPNSDQQSFVLILPRIINDHYRKLSFRDRQRPPGLSSSASPSGSSKQNLLRSMLSLSLSPAPSPFGAQLSSTFSQHRSHMDTVADRNKAINQFLINFLEHVYKDIDYSIRERRKFESSFLSGDMDYDEELGLGRGLDSSRTGTGATHSDGNGGGTIPTPATFCKDSGNSFTALIWLGHEWHLILFELLTVLLLDLWFVSGNSNSISITTMALVWFIYKILERFYVLAAKRNLVAKALLDEKFLST